MANFRLHWVDYSNKMKKINTAAEFCDVTLIAEGRRFPSSRIVLSASSDYFLKMFTSSFKEKQSEEVTIMNVEADDFQNLIDVCYTGLLNICDETAERLLRAAHLLQLRSAISICCEYMTNTLSTDNCLELWLLAKNLSLKEFEENVFRFCVANISHIAVEDIAVENFDELMRNSALVSMDHGTIFELIMNWIQHEPIGRIQYIIRLATRLDFNLIEKAKLDVYIDFLHGYDEAKYFLIDMMTFYNGPRNANLLFFSSKRDSLTPISLSNKGFEMYQESVEKWEACGNADPKLLPCEKVLAVHMEKKKLYIVVKKCHTPIEILFYDIGNDTITLREKRSTLYEEAAAVITYPMLYLAGTDQTLCSYDLITFGMRFPSGRMSIGRRFPGLAEINNVLYVFGGEHRNSDGSTDFTNSVEAFQFDTWTDCAPMLQPVSEMGVGVLRGKIYVLGGTSNVPSKFQCFDPAENSWSLLGNIIEATANCIVCPFADHLFVSTTQRRESQNKSVFLYSPEKDTWRLIETLKNVSKYIFLGTDQFLKN